VQTGSPAAASKSYAKYSRVSRDKVTYRKFVFPVGASTTVNPIGESVQPDFGHDKG
jgi:hypothetical protein